MENRPANHYSNFERYTTVAVFDDGTEVRWCGTDSYRWARKDAACCAREWGKRAKGFVCALVIDNRSGEPVAERS